MADEGITPEERDQKGWAYIRRIFNTFDKEKEETIPIDDLPVVLRLCGMVPSEGEIEEMRSIGDPESTGQVSWELFQACMNSCLDNYKSEKQLAAALQTFVPNEGKSITKTSLRYALTNFGDKLTDAEINQFFEDCPQEFDVDGVGHISEVVAKLTEFLVKQN
eukprot:GILI01015289.1.p2 GENE.GILI01015289.1~~GILI01015289.1.p2  ORF type:complete len:163 (-),score=33.88 GILI01015289.1:81-569(-)